MSYGVVATSWGLAISLRDTSEIDLVVDWAKLFISSMLAYKPSGFGVGGSGLFRRPGSLKIHLVSLMC